jgi:DNA recombination protein RmuC
MGMILTTIGGQPVSLGEAAVIGIAILFLVICLLLLWRAVRIGRRAETQAAARAGELEGQIGVLLQAQSEMTGRIQTMSEMLGNRQAELNQAVSERLDGMGHRLNQSVGEASKNTHDSLKTLHERLAVLDAAQQNISTLTGQVTALSNILSDKQLRGAFGQGRMEAIVSDQLPPNSFEFQFTLKSGARPDCIIRLPNGAPHLVIDAKFPLEAYNALKAADAPELLKTAQQRFRADLTRHVKDISEKYLVPGETHDTAFMFVPSESIFAEIHERFDDVIQGAYRRRVVIVSPSLLLLSIQVIQQVLRDHRLREQAHVIQDEVRKMMQDVARLEVRANKLASHFGAVQEDVKLILTSTDKISSRGNQIGAIGEKPPEEREEEPGLLLEMTAPKRIR